MTDKFILKGREVVPCPELEQWARWFETGERRVAADVIGEVRVSTVFLGLDHRFGDGPPLVFETMIFGGPHDGWQERCSTYDEAEAMHAEAVKLVRSGLN